MSLKISPTQEKQPTQFLLPSNEIQVTITQKKTESVAHRLLHSIGLAAKNIGSFIWQVISFPFTAITAILEKIFGEEESFFNSTQLLLSDSDQSDSCQMPDFSQRPLPLDNSSLSNCWGNSLLQCIFNSPDICKKIVENSHAPDTLPSLLRSLMSAYSSKNNQNCNSEKLREWLSKNNRFMSADNSQHEDASEALGAILGSLNIELSLEGREDQIIKRELDPSYEVHYKDVPKSTDGHTVLHISNPSLGDISLQELIDKDVFFVGERFYEEDSGIKGPNGKSHYTGRTIHGRYTQYFSSAPQDSVVISVKRFSWDEKNHVAKKLDFQILQPMSYHLDAAHTIDKKAADYEITNCIIHEGTATQWGHYIALVKKPNGWYKCSDSRIKLIKDAQEVEKLISKAYVLFLTRCPGKQDILSLESL